MAPPRRVITTQDEDRFLEGLSKGLSVLDASKASKASRDWLYNKRKTNEEFARRWDEAWDQGTDKLEAEAQRRAVEGVLKPVFQGGEEVGLIREYSDSLLVFLLKSRRPQRYRETAVNLTQNNLTLNLSDILMQVESKPTALPS